MNLDFIRKGQLAAAQWCKQLWQVRLSKVKCTSISGEKSITLSSQFLASADEFQIEFILQRPFMSLRRSRPISAAIYWIGGSEHSQLDRAEQRLPIACEIQQCPGLRANRIRARWSRASGGAPKGVLVEIRDGKSGTKLKSLSWPLLEGREVERLILRQLTVEERRLWIQSGIRRETGDLVADSSDFLIPEFRIAGMPLSAFQRSEQVPLRFELQGAQGKTPLIQRALKFTGTPVEIKGPAISLQDPRLFPQEGSYSIAAIVGDREITRFAFKIVGRQDLLKQVKIARIRIDAQTHSGGIAAGVRAVRWQEHRAFQPSLQIETAICAPNTVLRGRARLFEDSHLLRCEEFEVRLEFLCQQLKLQSIELNALGITLRKKPSRLTLSVCLEEQPKQNASVVVLPRERITNFEGQLCVNPENMLVDEAEYEQIIRRLGVLNPAPRRRWFLRRPW